MSTLQAPAAEFVPAAVLEAIRAEVARHERAIARLEELERLALDVDGVPPGALPVPASPPIESPGGSGLGLAAPAAPGPSINGHSPASGEEPAGEGGAAVSSLAAAPPTGDRDDDVAAGGGGVDDGR